MALRTGYLHDDAFDDGFLQVSDLHTVHYYQFGKKDGKPGELLKDCRHGRGLGGSFNSEANTSQSFSSTVDLVQAAARRTPSFSTHRPIASFL
jgi:hypothetical protein